MKPFEFQLITGPTPRKIARKIVSVGQEDFDLSFCQMCPLPRLLCKHLRFSLEIKPKREIIGNFRDTWKKLKEIPKLEKQLKSEETKRKPQIKELGDRIKKIEKQTDNLRNEKLKMIEEKKIEIEKTIDSLNNEKLKMIEEKKIEIENEYKPRITPLDEEIQSINAKLEGKQGFLGVLLGVDKNALQGRKLSLTNKVRSLESEMAVSLYEKIKTVEKLVSLEIKKKQIELKNQLQTISLPSHKPSLDTVFETPEIKELEEKKSQLESILGEKISPINEMKEKLRQLREQLGSSGKDLVSFSLSSAACSLRLEPISSNLKECENCKDQVLIDPVES